MVRSQSSLRLLAQQAGVGMGGVGGQRLEGRGFADTSANDADFAAFAHDSGCIRLGHVGCQLPA